MRRNTRAFGAILGLAAMPLFLACSDVAGPDEPLPPTPPEPVASLTVVPSTLELETGDVVWIRAIIANPAEGEVADERAVRWESSNPRLVQVSDGAERALLRAVAPGTVTIRARYEGLSGSARVSVIHIGRGHGDGDDELDRDRKETDETEE